MDISSQPSSDEDRVMQRQLYRAGENNKPAPKAPTPSGIKSSSTPAAPPRPAAKKGKPGSDQTTKGQRILQHILLLGFGYYLLYGTPEQRKRVYKGLGVAAWLLFLCGVSYCIFLPDLESLANERRNIWMDQSLTKEEKRDKMKDLDTRISKLSPSQRKELRSIDTKARIRKGNSDIVKFLQLTPEQRFAETKKRVAEMEKMRAQWAANRPKNDNKKGPGNNGRQGGGPGAGGGGRGGGGPGGGGWGGGGGGPPGGAMMDSQSPEARSGRRYQGGLMQQMGGFGGGRGGGGGGGGPGGGGGGRGGGGGGGGGR